MPEARRERVYALDGWRGAAILLVLAGHFCPVPGINLARVGVDLFFALSGRLMADLLFAQRTPLRVFFFRRFSRVWPALAGLVILCVVLFDATSIRVGARAALAALTFTANYASVWGLRCAVLDHVWSLCVEEHAYLALGAVAYVSRRGLAPAGALVFALAAAALANGLLRSDMVGDDYYVVFWRSDVAAAPIFVAAGVAMRRDALAALGRSSPLWLAAGVAAKAALFGAALRFGFGALALALAVATLERAPAAWLRLLEMRWLRGLGAASYSIYLWQQPFYELHARGAGLWTLAAALAVGFASFHGLENPARLRLYAWFDNSTSRARGKAVEPARIGA